jgi:capsular polysaccharide transport system permease protein
MNMQPGLHWQPNSPVNWQQQDQRDNSMQGAIKPAGEVSEAKGVLRYQRIQQALRRYRWFLLLVVLPTLLTASYLFLVTSDQYESSTDFIVRRAQGSAKGPLGMGQVFGFSIGTDQSRADAYFVEEYLLSHDSVSELRKNDQLVERFQRSGADIGSRLWYANPKPEALLEYFRKHVDITQDDDTGISHLRVRAFSPEDAFALCRKLLAMGEGRINSLNERTFSDQVANALRDRQVAEVALAKTQTELTNLRQSQRDIDPASSGRAQIGLVTNATSQLMLARSRLQSMGQFLSKSSPQYIALASQVRALEAQISGQASQIAGTGPSIAGNLGNFEDLVIRKEIAAQRFASASASYENAKSDAVKQQLYLTRIVEPNLPVKSLFPQRIRIVATIFFGLIMAYAIGWLLAAGIKEHSI